MRQTSSRAEVDAIWHPQERRAFLYLPLLAMLVSIVVELFNHKTFTEGPASLWRFVSDEPLAFLVDVLIVLVTLSPAFFFRRRAFWCALGVLSVAGGRRGERVHPPQPYDALHRGGSDGV